MEETKAARTKRLKSEYYHKNKGKFRGWARDRYTKTNPRSADDIRSRILDLQQLLHEMEKPMPPDENIIGCNRI